ncbi:MAG: DUF2243 domain-containing protein [Candidatus Nanopelagicales bacterium]
MVSTRVRNDRLAQVGRKRPARTPWVLLGVGVGGLVDGIVLHQLLQWHHLLSSVDDPRTVGGLELNTLADGAFHVASLLVALAGIAGIWLSWRRGSLAPRPAAATGLVLVGWGGFNVVEGLVDHLVLGVHHVRDDLGGPLAWDLGFLVLSALVVGVGWVMASAHPR